MTKKYSFNVESYEDSKSTQISKLNTHPKTPLLFACSHMTWPDPLYVFPYDLARSPTLVTGTKRTCNTRLILGVLLLAVIAATAISLGVYYGVTNNAGNTSKLNGEPPTTTSMPKTDKPTTTEKPQVTERPAKWIDLPCMMPDVPDCPAGDPPLLLFSLDGFRADYLLRGLTPTLKKLSQCGVHTPYLRSVYPTKTFPNHYTIVTGLYPESHGLVENSMYDYVLNATYTIGSSQGYNPAWYEGEPLWSTVHKFGKKSASYYWVGSDVNISGDMPDIYYRYGRTPIAERIDTVLDWLTLPADQRPAFITLYYNEPDHLGHDVGPYGEKMNDLLQKLDEEVIGRLMDGLYERNLHNCVNVMILADHGMAPLSCSRQIVLDQYINVTEYIMYASAFGQIYTNYYRERGVVLKHDPEIPAEAVAKDLVCHDPKLLAFMKETMPKRHHYINNRRIGDVVLDVQSNWTMSKTKRTNCLQGNHGYDNLFKNMHALFLAHGPSLKQNLKVDPFENIELYNIMAELLKVTPAPNNGTVGSLQHMLRNPKPEPAMRSQNAIMCSAPTNHSVGKQCSCEVSIGNIEPPVVNNIMDPLLGNYVAFGFLQTEGTDVCLLPQSEFITGYSQIFNMPVWSMFDLEPNQVNTSRLIMKTKPCFQCDERVSGEAADCCNKYHDSREKADGQYLFHPAFSRTAVGMHEAMLSSNMAPMKHGFQHGIWKFLWELIADYADNQGHLSIITGPLFDYNYDGLWEGIINETVFVSSGIPLPTHYFVVISRCRYPDDIGECPPNNHVLSFILPNLETIPNCLSNERHLIQSFARIRDIEYLAGFELFIRYDRHKSTLLRTFLPTSLWESHVLDSWIDLPCPVENDPACPAGQKPLLLVSLDGFRADYLQRNFTPTIQKLATCGVHSPYMRSVYPTVTFPNHYTIVTGLYPESHGVVYNTMFDPDIGIFTLSNSQAVNPAWWGGEPIWITADKGGKRTASYFWPGSGVNISGHYPDMWEKYSGSISYEERVDTVLEWLSLPVGKRPDFVTLYFNEPDHEGHVYGPESEAMNQELHVVDRVISNLMNGLYRKQLHNCVDVIIVADHGMQTISSKKEVYFPKLMPDNYWKVLAMTGIVGRLETDYVYVNSSYYEKNPDPLPVQEVVDNLMCKSTHMKVFTKDTLPKRHHYIHNRRIGDIVLDMEAGWAFKMYPSKYANPYLGNHGYDNLYKSMQALFIAHGPSFKQELKIEPFENIELYNLMAELLNVTPAPNNGTQGSLSHILKRPFTSPPMSPHYNYSLIMDWNGTALTECNCSNLSMNMRMMSASPERSLPFGLPLLAVMRDAYHLPQADHMTGYSEDIHMPLWSSFTVTREQANRTSTRNPLDQCVVVDPRVKNLMPASMCPTANMSASIGYMFPPVLTDTTTSFLSSNLVPMKTNFKNGIWHEVLLLIGEYSRSYGNINVVVGPAFDYDYDGRVDGKLNETKYIDSADMVPMPTQYYVILSKCRTPGMAFPCDGNVDVLSFILPHLEDTPNCLGPMAYLRDNVARVRDVEELTGLEFFSSLNFTTRTALRTFLPTTLWTILNPRTWKDQPCPVPNNPICPEGKRPLLLVSLDGFKAEYLLRNFTPSIARLAKCGVHSPYMRSVYPTKTFPNHYSIVTGLYPESHGIVGNHMYDAKIGHEFSIRNSQARNAQWWQGEPFWTTAQKQGKRSACMFWPGSSVNISGHLPDYWSAYDSSFPFEDRVDRVLGWLMLPSNLRPDFMTLYLSEPDHTGHISGPDSSQVNVALARVDKIIDRLMTGLYERRLHDCVNLIVLADHGMSHVSCESRRVNLNQYMNMSSLLMFGGPYGRIDTHYHRNGSEIVETIVDMPVKTVVDDLQCASPHLKVFTKETIPVRHHYINNPRIGEIVIDVEDRWQLFQANTDKCDDVGTHGFDNLYQSMHALFLAHGPSFQQQMKIDPFENIELHNLFADLLNINPAPNNGTAGTLHHILRHPRPLPAPTTHSYDSIVIPASISLPECFCPLSQIDLSTEATNLLTYTSAGAVYNYLPFGMPGLHAAQSVMILPQRDAYGVGYSRADQMPLWASVMLKKQQFNAEHVHIITGGNTGRPGKPALSDHLQVLVNFPFTNESQACIQQDPRIEYSPSYCRTSPGENMSYYQLVPEGFVSSPNSSYSSAYVPMYKGFHKGIWGYMKNLIVDFVEEFGDMNLILGPVIDSNNDELWDRDRNNTRYMDIDMTVPIPTGFYVILIKCKDANATLPCGNNIDILSFILPHVSAIPNCRAEKEYLRYNVVRIRDIELITGLRFFSDLPSVQAARLRTFLPTSLWKSKMTRKWHENSCSYILSTKCQSDYRPLLLVSLGGFQADYMLKNLTPVIQRLSECGVKAPFMRPVFPTTTYPSLYSIVTGLYPESHGIISDDMYDRDMQRKFYLKNSASFSDPTDTRWWNGQPIWNSVSKEGGRSAAYWVGSDAPINGQRPDDYIPFNQSMSLEERVDRVITWLNNPVGQRPDFLALSLNEPNDAGRRYGPDSTQVRVALASVDAAIGQLIDGLQRINLENCVNIMIVSDHGMADHNCNKRVRLNRFIAPIFTNIYVFEGVPGRISNKIGFSYGVSNRNITDETPLKGIIRNLTCRVHQVGLMRSDVRRDNLMLVSDKRLLPKRYHYANNKRIDDIVLDMSSGSVVYRNSWRGVACDSGDSGFDNAYRSMNALFMAYGPAFKENFVVEPFESIELYNIMAEILNVTASPNNGTAGRLSHILRKPSVPAEASSNYDYSGCNALITVQELEHIMIQSNCPCSLEPSELQVMVTALNNSMVNRASYHAPVGIPRLGASDVVCELTQWQYITAYGDSLRWTSATFHRLQILNMTSHEMHSSCTVPDPRLPADSSNKCDQDLPTNITWSTLLYTEYLQVNGKVWSTDVVPMMAGFRSGIWQHLLTRVRNWTVTYGEVNVVAGPVYDYNFDGIADNQESIQSVNGANIPVPTHYYMIISKCNDRGLEQLSGCLKHDVMSFILPHVADFRSCQEPDMYLLYHNSRVRDVELLTKLEFFTDLPSKEALVLRTYLPVSLWWIS